jgi:hypothetical protein
MFTWLLFYFSTSLELAPSGHLSTLLNSASWHYFLSFHGVIFTFKITSFSVPVILLQIASCIEISWNGAFLSPPPSRRIRINQNNRNLGCRSCRQLPAITKLFWLRTMFNLSLVTKICQHDSKIILFWSKVKRQSATPVSAVCKVVILQQAEVAQGVPSRLSSRIFLTFDTTRVVGRHPYAPAAFTPGEIPGTHFQGWVDNREHGSFGGGHGKSPQWRNRSRDRPISRAVP